MIAAVDEVTVWVADTMDLMGTSPRTLATVAVAAAKSAGREVDRIRRDGWPTSRPLDLGDVDEADVGALRKAIRYAAACVAAEQRRLAGPTAQDLAIHRAGGRGHVVEADPPRHGLSGRSGRREGFDARATGGTAQCERCTTCGAERWTLRNGVHEDRGEWT